MEAVPDALSKFESALIQAGYSSAHDEEYLKTKLRIMEEGLFHVAENFPRLIQKTFQRGVPTGIEKVEYEINLTGFENLQIATNPNEFVWK